MVKVIDDALRQWVGECFIRFVDEDTIRSLLARQGLEPGQIDSLIAEGESHPYVTAGRMMARNYQRLEWLLRVYEYSNSQSIYDGKIERRSNLSRSEFLESYYSVNRPVILTGLTEGWPARTRWTPEYLKSNFGHFPVEIKHYKATEQGTYDFLNEDLLFGDYVDMVTQAGITNEFYLTAYNAEKYQHLLRELLKDVVMPTEYLDPHQIEDKIYMWYGPAGTVTKLHIDSHNVFLAQAVGRKLVRLVPSFHLPHVYQQGDFFSPVNPEELDLETYPLFQNAQVMEFILEPGEILFIPVAWWHQVRALDWSISLSFTNFHFGNDYRPFSQVYGSFPGDLPELQS